MDIQQGFTKDLPAKLTPEEIENRSRQLARQIETIAEVEEEKAKNARQFGEKLKGMRLLAMTLAHAVSSGEEARPVLCSERADYRRFTIETYRHDTSEVVESKAMTADQVEEARQGHLAFVRVAGEYEKDRVEKETGTRPTGGGLDLDSPPIVEKPKKGKAAKAAPEQFGSQLKDALEGITNPDGKGTTLVSHGFGGELRPVVVPGDAPPAADPTEITAPTSILEGKIRKAARESKAVKLSGGFASGLAAAEAEANAARIAAEAAEELPPIEGVAGVEGAGVEGATEDDTTAPGEEPADDGG